MSELNETETGAFEVLQLVSRLKLENKQRTDDLLGGLEECNSIDLKLESFSHKLMEMMKSGTVDPVEIEILKGIVLEVLEV
jgi:hypothetical protein